MIGEEQQVIDGPLGVDAEREARRTFWLTHMEIGFSVFLGETLVVMVYLGLTPDGPHRTTLWFVAALWLVFAVAGMCLAPTVASKSWRATYSVTWTVLSAFAVGLVAVLDTGSDSPILLLLFLPLVYAALMFTPRAAGFCGLASLASATVVTLVDRRLAESIDRAFMTFAVLAGAFVLSVAASINRAHIERHERQLRAAMADLAATDELTGCNVRRVLRQRMEAEISRSMRNHCPLSFMMIDVDQFKSVNDTYGHVVGDHVLATVGAVLRMNARSFDLASRVGGDEFALLLPDAVASGAVAVAERIRQGVSARTEVQVTLSIGVCALDRVNPTVEQMFDDADLALYQAKRSGRDAIAVRHPSPAPVVDGAARTEPARSAVATRGQQRFPMTAKPGGSSRAG
ncbi:MAG: GGDEF domain-containing protein [Acidimicrobiales bacterium]